jgi:muramidase (phage lysozyme)
VTPNQIAFLDAIAFSELGERLMAASDDGYNVVVGSTPKNPILFSDYSDHPRRLVTLPALGIKSTAAGRYQLLARYFDAYKKQLGLKDFSPASQDAIALQQIRECKALADVDTGNFAAAVAKCRRIWASLPGSPYGQHTNSLDDLQAAFVRSGGRLA